MVIGNLRYLEKLDRSIIVDECSSLQLMDIIMSPNKWKTNCTLTSALVLSVTSIKNSDWLSIICCRIFWSTLLYMTMHGDSQHKCVLLEYSTYTAPRLSEFDTKRYSFPSFRSWSRTPEWTSESYRSPWPGGYQAFFSSSACLGHGSRVSS